MIEKLPEGPITKALDVLDHLLDKISNATGWIVKNNEKIIAHEMFIEEIKKSNMDPLVKASIISNAWKIIKENNNQINIIKNAQSFITETSKIDLISDSWLSLFMDKARMVNEDDFQTIWGKILAEECNNPGSIPKSLLHTLSIMDRNDALAFSKIKSMSVYFVDINDETYIQPFINLDNYDNYCSKINLKYDDFVSLSSLGLIEYDFNKLNAYSVYPKSNIKCIKYFEKEKCINPPAEDFNCGNVIYTKIGTALAKTIITEEYTDFFEKHCIDIIEPIPKNNALSES